MKSFNIENRKIGANEPTFIIAEIGQNHNGNLDMALELISVAKNVELIVQNFKHLHRAHF